MFYIGFPPIFGTLPYSARGKKPACVPFKRVIGMYKLQGVRGVLENHRERIQTGWNGIWIYTGWIDTVGLQVPPHRTDPLGCSYDFLCRVLVKGP